MIGTWYLPEKISIGGGGSSFNTKTPSIINPAPAGAAPSSSIYNHPHATPVYTARPEHPSASVGVHGRGVVADNAIAPPLPTRPRSPSPSSGQTPLLSGSVHLLLSSFSWHSLRNYLIYACLSIMTLYCTLPRRTTDRPQSATCKCVTQPGTNLRPFFTTQP